VSDWLGAGGTADELQALIERAPTFDGWQNSGDVRPVIDIREDDWRLSCSRVPVRALRTRSHRNRSGTRRWRRCRGVSATAVRLALFAQLLGRRVVDLGISSKVLSSSYITRLSSCRVPTVAPYAFSHFCTSACAVASNLIITPAWAPSANSSSFALSRSAAASFTRSHHQSLCSPSFPARCFEQIVRGPRSLFDAPIRPDPARVDAGVRGSCAWSTAARGGHRASDRAERAPHGPEQSHDRAAVAAASRSSSSAAAGPEQPWSFQCARSRRPSTRWSGRRSARSSSEGHGAVS